MDIQNYEKKAKSILDKIASSKAISGNNKKLILKYYTNHSIEVKFSTMYKWLGFMYYYLIHSKDIVKEANSEELYKAVFGIHLNAFEYLIARALINS